MHLRSVSNFGFQVVWVPREAWRWDSGRLPQPSSTAYGGFYGRHTMPVRDARWYSNLPGNSSGVWLAPY